MCEEAENRAGTGGSSARCPALAGRELAPLQRARVGSDPASRSGAPARPGRAQLPCSAGTSGGDGPELTPLEAACVLSS